MGNKKLIVMSSIPDSAIDEMNELSKQWLDQSFKLDEEFEQKLKKDEARWPNKQYLIVPRACGKTGRLMNDKDLMKKLSMMTNEEIEKEAKRLMDDGMPKELIKPIWEDELLKEQIANTTDEDIEKFRESWNGTVKDLTLNTTDEDVEEFRKSLGVTDSWHIEAEIKETPAERKKRLMRLEKEILVDMVFNLESRNEFLLHNLSEVEKMYNKLKEEEE